jgi:hypothetical protein
MQGRKKRVREIESTDQGKKRARKEESKGKR